MQHIVLNFKKLQTYEAGSLLLAVLAYPHINDDAKRAGPYHALCSTALRARSQLDAQWSSTPQRIKPVYAFYPERDIKKELNALKRQLHHRMIAGRMAVAFLKEVATGQVPVLPKGIKRLSVNQMSELVLEDAGQSDPENVETRIWRASLPVIHLAAACQTLMQQSERETGRALHLGDLIMNREVIGHVVRTGEEFRQMLAKSTRLRPIDPRLQVQIRLATQK
jgi:hypothetical protein